MVHIDNQVIYAKSGKAILNTTGPTIKMKGGNRRRGGPPDFTKRLDNDGDGKVSLDEFDGPKRGFNHLDKHGDGFISEDNAPKDPPERDRRRRWPSAQN